MGGENLSGVGEIVTRPQGNLVSLCQLRTLTKFGLDPRQGGFHWPVVEPIQDAEREEVFRAIDLFAREFNIALQRIHIQRRDGQLQFIGPSKTMSWETIIGLEIHAQLST